MGIRSLRFTQIEVVNSLKKHLIDGALQDQPQSNGRAEVSVQWVKAEIRRILHAAGAPFSRWPLAARNLNERLRLRQIGKPANVPNFLEPVLIRKRFWRTMELLPTQEKPCTSHRLGSVMDTGSNVKMEASL